MILAKKIVALIQNDYVKEIAYIAIAIKQARLDPKAAKKTAALIEDDNEEKYEAYIAIATELVKSDPEAAKKYTALIENSYDRDQTYSAIATEEAKSDPEAAKTAALILYDFTKSETYYNIARHCYPGSRAKSG